MNVAGTLMQHCRYPYERCRYPAGFMQVYLSNIPKDILRNVAGILRKVAGILRNVAGILRNICRYPS